MSTPEAFRATPTPTPAPAPASLNTPAPSRVHDIPHRSQDANWKLSWWGVLHSEWIKFWSLKSAWVIVPLTYLLAISAPIMMALALNSHKDSSAQFALENLKPFFDLSAGFSSFMVIAYSVLVITNEWSTGSIYSSVSAVPSRTPLFFAKIVVVQIITITVQLLSFLTIIGTLQILDFGVNNLWTGSGFWILIGTQLLSTMFTSMFAFLFGTALRNTAVALVLVYVLTSIVEGILVLLSTKFEWLTYITCALPSVLVNSINNTAIGAETGIGMGTNGIKYLVAPQWGFLGLALWVIIGGGIAWYLLKRRDI